MHLAQNMENVYILITLKCEASKKTNPERADILMLSYFFEIARDSWQLLFLSVLSKFSCSLCSLYFNLQPGKGCGSNDNFLTSP